MHQFIIIALFTLIATLGNSSNTLAQVPEQTTRKIILEELTGTWCGLCPAGSLTFDYVLANYPNVIGVSAHVSDPMTTDDSDELATLFSGGGVNLFLLDRYLFPDLDFVQFTFEQEPLVEKIEERLTGLSPVSVIMNELVFEEASRELSVNVTAYFHEEMSPADLRLNLWVVEDSIPSTGSGYQQTSFFDAYDGHPLNGAGNPIQGFVHKKVLRQSLGGNWGTQGSISYLSPSIGDSFTYTYQTILPEDYDLHQIYLVGLVQQYSSSLQSRSILNAEEVKLLPNTPGINQINTTTNTYQAIPIVNKPAIDATISNQLPSKNIRNQINNLRINNITIPPSPTNTELQLQIDVLADTPASINLYNLNGALVKHIKTGTLLKGKHQINIDNTASLLSPGIYLVYLQTTNQKIVRKVYLH